MATVENGRGSLQGQTAVVTGAASGIGRGIVGQLLRAGARVVAADIDEERLVKTAEALGALRAHVDVSDRDSVFHMRDEAVRQLGAVDILVCNAGVCRSSPLLDLTQEEWDRTFAVNIRGVFFCVQAFGELMVERRRGCVVTIASVSGRQGDPTLSHYSATKFAVIGFTQAVARELGPYGVRANALCPGTVDTEMGRALASQWGMTISELAERDQIVKRPVTPEEVGAAVVFLAGMPIITGQALNIDGGLVFS
jgi:meso-butanediol dehydrogenase/(S,S)-butanediol dehydrogenase/diacetyl reductase